MATERIESLISKEALAQFEQLKSLSDANVSSFEKLIAKTVELNKQLGGAKTFKQVVEGTRELEKAEEQLIDTQEAVLKSQERLKKANHDLGDSFDRIGQKIGKNFAGSTEDAFEKLVKLNDALKQNKKAQQDLQGQKDTFGQMNKSLPEVQRGLLEILNKEKELKAEEILLRRNVQDTNKEIKQRLSLQIVTPGTRAEIKETITNLKLLRDNKIDINTEDGKKQIAELNEEIDRLSKIMEQTTDKLDKRKINIGNYPGAVRILEQALIDVNKKIDDFTKSGNDNQQMLQSLTKEQELLQTLVEGQSNGFNTATAAIKGNTKAIQLLSQVYGEDSEIVQKLITDTASLTDQVGDLRNTIKARASDTKVFDGLIDAAQGLAGVYTIAQGASALFGEENEELQKTFVKLQAAMAVLQGLQAIQNVLQKESQARQLVTIGLQKIAVLQTNLETAAQSKNIIVKYAAIAAQKALNVALSLAGGPLLAVIGLLALLLVSLSSFAASTENATKSLEKLNDELEINAKLNEESVDAIKQANEIAVAELQSRFASESEIRQKIFSGLQQELKEREDFNNKNRVLFEKADDTIRKYIGVKEYGYNSEGKLIEKQKQLNDEEQKELDAAISIRDRYNESQDRQFELEREIRIKRLEFLRQNTQDFAKLSQNELEVLKISLQSRSAVLSSTAGDDRKAFDERIKALQEFGRLQEQIINTDAKKQTLTPGLSPSELRIIEANRSAAITQARRDSQKQIEDLTRQFNERERRAQFDIARTAIETQSAAAQEIAGNQEKSLEERLFAALEFQKAQEAIITGQRNIELSNATLTSNERKAIEEKANADILATKISFNKQVQEITLAELDEENRIRVANNNKERDEAIQALNDRFNAGKISLAEYNRERLNLEKAYTLEALDIEISNIQKVIEEYKKQGKDVADLESQLADFQKQKSDEVTNKKIDDLNKLHALQKQLAGEAFEFVKGIFDAQFVNQKNEVQGQIDQLEKKKEKDIEVANASIQNEQERVAAIQTINLRAQAQKEALERRQRQLDLERARFEKLANISSIIANTASAIVKQLVATPLPAGLPFVLTIGSIGALQLARAIAAPLPKFAEGTLDAPGGLSLVGDGGKKELVVTPDGRLIETPDVPTVMNVPKHSIVFPDLKMLTAGMFVNQHGRLVDNRGDIQALGQMLGSKIDRLNNTIKNKKEVHVRGKVGRDIMFSSGNNESKYLNNNLQG